MHRIANPISPVRLRAAPPLKLVTLSAPLRMLMGLFCFTMNPGLDGEIGRHSGLKIRRFPE